MLSSNGFPMCRMVAYLGPPVGLDALLFEPEHSLLVQSYRPKEMTGGTINADGFGIAWYDPARGPDPFVYRNTLPIWNDANLPDLARYVRAGTILANVRSATPGQAVSIENCHPFASAALSLMHNGFVADFRATLYRRLRTTLSDAAYGAIHGTTDSEHIFASVMDRYRKEPSLAEALRTGLQHVRDVGANIPMSLTAIVSDGKRLAAARMAQGGPPPSLYWIRDSARFPGAVLIASEPLFADDGWHSFPEHGLADVSADGQVTIVRADER